MGLSTIKQLSTVWTRLGLLTCFFNFRECRSMIKRSVVKQQSSEVRYPAAKVPGNSEFQMEICFWPCFMAQFSVLH